MGRHNIKGKVYEKRARKRYQQLLYSKCIDEHDGGEVRWKDGRRIVELGCSADNLGNCGAVGCDLLQDLRNTVGEKRCGLGRTLLIKYSCGELNGICTGKTHRVGNNGVVYDMNTKAAASMIHAGMSFT